MGMAFSISRNRAATESALFAEVPEEVLRFKISCALLVCSIASAGALSALQAEDPVLSGQVFMLLPSVRSSNVDEQRRALSDLRELASRKSDAPFAFALAERNVMDALQLSLITPGEEAAQLAVEQILLLGEIGSKNCLELLVTNVKFRGLDASYAGDERETRDLPAYSALLHLGLPAVVAVFRQALAEDDAFIREVLADLLSFHFGLQGALDWIDTNAAEQLLTVSQRDRLAAVHRLVEMRNKHGGSG